VTPRSLRSAGVEIAGVEIAIGTALAAAAWALYWPVVRLWWTHDDFYHLRLLLANPRAWYFWDRVAYRPPPPKMLTPLLFLSLDVDRFLFGFRPALFHLHQLASLSLAPPALYAVLRLWLARAWAALGAFVFLLGAPVASIVLMLMVRHYVEVIPLAALAVGLWVLALRRPEKGAALAVGSALVWFLAALEKETAVPLVLFLLLIPEGSLRERLRWWAPHAVALGAYAAIRLFFLGGPAQGYGFVVEKADWPRLALTLPLKVAAEIRGRTTPAAWLFLTLVLAGLGMAACFSRGNALRVAAALALTLAPALPVSIQMEPRYAVAAWAVAAMALPFACRGLAARGGAWRELAVGLAAVACVSGVLANRLDWQERLADSVRRSAEWRAFLTMAPGEMLRQPLGVPGELGDLRWWKEDVQGLPRGAGWFFDDLYLCLHPPQPGTGRVWGWDDASQAIVDLTPRLPAIRRASCGAIRGDAPLRVEIKAQAPGVAWDLGPYHRGRYRFVLDDGIAAVDMPRTGGFHLRRRAPLSLRVKYESPDGWVTYSPLLTIDLATRAEVRWQR